MLFRHVGDNQILMPQEKIQIFLVPLVNQCQSLQRLLYAGLGAPDETADVTDSSSENRAAQRRRPGKPASRLFAARRNRV